MIGGLFEVVAKPMEWMYSLTHSYIAMISFMALIVIVITAPLVLKSTKGMLEMQKLAPETKKLQQLYRNDRQKLNEEMMKLYQSRKVNPLASCLPLVLQMPVFIIMYRLLHGLTNPGNGQPFEPKYLTPNSVLQESLYGETKMMSLGLDLARRPIRVLAENPAQGIIYALLVIAMAGLYLVQQRMVASRSQAAPSMSANQQKIMQYLPVVFAFFMVFYVTGLVIFYMAQAIFRIGLNYYITHRFYKGDESLGRQAMKAGEEARELAKKDGGGGGGMFAQAKRELASAKSPAKDASGKAGGAKPPITSGRATPPKNKPTPTAGGTRPPSSGRSSRPQTPQTRHPKKK